MKSDKGNIVSFIMMLIIALVLFGWGTYQFMYGITGAGINSRGGVGVSYGGTSIAMGLLILFLSYTMYRNDKKKNKR